MGNVNLHIIFIQDFQVGAFWWLNPQILVNLSYGCDSADMAIRWNWECIRCSMHSLNGFGHNCGGFVSQRLETPQFIISKDFYLIQQVDQCINCIQHQWDWHGECELTYHICPGFLGCCNLMHFCKPELWVGRARHGHQVEGCWSCSNFLCCVLELGNLLLVYLGPAQYYATY